MVKLMSNDCDLTPKETYITYARARLVIVSFLVVFSLLWPTNSWSGRRRAWARNITHDNSHEGKAATETNIWRWTDLKPSTNLQWEKCFQDFECARLDVPLDWLEPSNNIRVALAVIRLRATEFQDYKGPVFINPGGPGGSGVETVLEFGKAYQTIIGRNHDIISFDPRGVGATSLKISCWPSARSGQIWSLLDVGTIDSHPGVLYDAYARAVAESSVCASTMGGGNVSGVVPSDENERRMLEAGPARFVSTTSTARDMLEILDKTGWPRLRYHGFSYGTMLGGMFAAMFPDRVERLVSDGNVDYGEWTTTTHVHFLADADKVMDAFYYFCHKVGPLKCAFYESTPAAIEVRLDALLARLRIRPVTTAAPTGALGVPEMVFYSNVKRLISAALYQPVLMFPHLAEVLGALEQGDAAPFVNYVISEGSRIPFTCGDDKDGLPDHPSAAGTDDAFKAIMCTDGPGLIDGLDEFEKYAAQLQNQSRAAGPVNVLFKMACAGWSIPAKWTFKEPIGGSTYYPILFIGNTADNVTPLRSARANAAKFNRSALLIQDSYGHTSLSTPSTCTASYIRAYFQNGTLPKPGTVCAPDTTPFGDDARLESTSEEEKETTDALWQLALRPHKSPL